MIQLIKRDPPRHTMRIDRAADNMKPGGGWRYQDGGRWWFGGGVTFISCPTCGLSIFLSEIDKEGEAFVKCPFAGCGFFGAVKLIGYKP